MSHPDAWAALCELLENLSDLDLLSTSWVRVERELLQFCREWRPAPDDWDSRPGEPWSTITEVTATAMERLHESTGVSPGSDAWFSAVAAKEHVATLWDLAQEQARSENAVTPAMAAVRTAYALALAVDGLVGETFEPHHRAKLDFEIDPDGAHPLLVRPGVAGIDVHEMNTRPSSHPHRGLEATPHLALGRPVHSRFRFVLDWDAFGRLFALDELHEFVVAVLEPTLTLDEYAIVTDDRFYRNLGPRDPRRQARRIARMVEKATQSGASLVVLHEYALTESMWDYLCDQGRDMLSKPVLIIAGVVTETGPGSTCTNEARMLFPREGMGMQAVAHTKLHGAHLGELQEQITTSSEIRIFASDRWALAVLLCLDTLDSEVVEALIDIGVNLLVVPTMSAKTKSMANVMARLSTGSQGLAIMANGPVAWGSEPDPERFVGGRAEAVFSGPYRDEPDVLRFPEVKPGPAHGTGMWIFNFTEREGVWYGEHNL
ncbi:hypothetical protein [Aeromicrobium sp.]|uniref:hypothetical protein n=1 Tax=Aeromicrobium sp. TaxID=1871063 RepID=UPI0028AC69EF|nr:hypothetical protein [Aeromicrobium sp.]